MRTVIWPDWPWPSPPLDPPAPTRARPKRLELPFGMRISLPSTAHLQNIDAFLRRCDMSYDGTMVLGMHPKWVTVHPMVLSMTACAGAAVRHDGGVVNATIPDISSLPYLIRMGLFDVLGVEPPKVIKAHEESGRFIPLT